MTRNDGYASPGAVESAISAAARKASNTDPSLTIQERIRLEYFHRFLSRLFSEENDSTGCSREAPACWRGWRPPARQPTSTYSAAAPPWMPPSKIYGALPPST